MSLEPRDIIISPVISEKSFASADRGKYTFVVHRAATKPEIRRAVEQIWGVRVTAVKSTLTHVIDPTAAKPAND